jgi:hypothetical protein
MVCFPEGLVRPNWEQQVVDLMPERSSARLTLRVTVCDAAETFTEPGVKVAPLNTGGVVSGVDTNLNVEGVPAQ